MVGSGLGVGVLTLGTVLAFLATACGSPATTDSTRRGSSTGVIIESGEVGTQRLRVGDCFMDPPRDVTQVVRGVPCSEQHSSQVVALVEFTDLDFPEWPGEAELSDRARIECFDSAVAALDGNLTDPTIAMAAYIPDERSWQLGDRRILCTLGRHDGSMLVGSLLGRST